MITDERLQETIRNTDVSRGFREMVQELLAARGLSNKVDLVLRDYEQGASAHEMAATLQRVLTAHRRAV